jgi:glycosyltransferase involved in cell wall biosynthesis
MNLSKHPIGFVSTRFRGHDGVSLESEKWLHVLSSLGYPTFLFGGDCDVTEMTSTLLVPEAHFQHPEILKIQKIAFSSTRRPPEITQKIYLMKDHLKRRLHEFVSGYGIRLLVVENALAIPLNIPLGLAITELIAETGMPTIAHHHDFFWERNRFLVNCVWDYLNMAFPPHLPSIRHVVINTSASNQLSLRTGISAMMIPNVMDFEHPPVSAGAYIDTMRSDFGIQPGEYFFLQPTRVVQRKGIEHAIELIQRLGREARLIISHASGDEGDEYENHVKLTADLAGVPVNFVCDTIQERRGSLEDGRKVYTLWDAYQAADLITYPSSFEGFGNAFLEAIYFRKPIVVSNYSIYNTDIKPKGFKVIEFDGFITQATVDQTLRLLDDSRMRQDMADTNYRLGKRFYSYKMLRRRLQTLLAMCFGEETNQND